MIKNIPTVKKNATTIDKFVEENDIEKIDLKKIKICYIITVNKNQE